MPPMKTNRSCLLFLPVLALCAGARAEAGPVLLTANDVALALYASPDGASYTPLHAANLVGVFGPHRCQCPNTLAVQLQTTATGQASIGNSTIGVTFLMGGNCLAEPSSCVTLGQASFTAAQSAESPTFSSSAVFKAAAGAAAVTCGALVAGSTTIWAVLTQDGVGLAFAPSIAVPITTASVAAPTAVTATPSDQGLLVGWVPPRDASLVAGYQVLCLPGPTVPETAGYEACGLASSAGTLPNPANPSQVCSPVVSPSTTSVRISGLANGGSYTVAVIAIDPSGGVSPLSTVATAMPQETLGFWEEYKQDGGAAVACTISHKRGGSGGLVLVLGLAACLGLLRGRRRRWTRLGLPIVFFSVATAGSAAAQEAIYKDTDDWARVDNSTSRLASPPNWGFEVGVSWYRPAIDDEFSGASRPFADTFSGSRRPMWVAELDRYLGHGIGTWGVSFRAGFYRVSAKAFLADGTGQRSGDETSLRLIPLALSAFYRATHLPGLGPLPLVPYAKLGLDAVDWTVTKTGDSSTQSNVSIGWHATAGVMFSLAWLGIPGSPEGVADPLALFFEWNYSRIGGLGLTDSLQVGDNTWFAGVMFDL